MSTQPTARDRRRWTKYLVEERAEARVYRSLATRRTDVITFGSGFGTDPSIGAFRIVFLAPPADLHRIYDLIGEYTGEFLAGRAS